MNESRSSDEIRFERRGPLGIITLTRPKALNALTLDMIHRMDPCLAAWAEDDSLQAVVIKGEGERAFCAGGDIRDLWQEGQNGGDLPARFFRDEYRLNHRIRRYGKPYVALIDGIVMGGGVGISIHGSHRVVTERSLFAMPETGIGLFPDVGGTFVLSRMPGALGLYLGLSGARLKAADCLHAGVGTHFVEAARLGDLEAALAAADWSGGSLVVGQILASLAGHPGPAPLAERSEAIERCFNGESVEDILAALQKEDSDWAAATLTRLERCSPTSLKITFRALKEAAEKDFEAAMLSEYRISQGCMRGHDFYEGVRALVIDKDNAPAWQPATLDEVDETMVAAHFIEPAAGDLQLPRPAS